MASDLELFLIERIQEFDPTISVEEGSAAKRIIVDPTTERFGADPFDIAIEDFIKDRLRQEFPSVDVDGTAVSDLLIKPQALFLDPLRREIQSIAIQQSIEDPTLLTEPEADALVANLFVSRVEGNISRGIARLYFTAPVSFSAAPNLSLSTPEGLVFHPSNLQSITSLEMQSNVEGNLFFFDVAVEAEVEGEDGNIAAGILTRVEGAPNVVRVTNKARFSGGTTRQTNQELKDFAENNITERSLTTRRGIFSQLPARFAIEDVIAVGYGDPEMDRDILEIIGNVLFSGSTFVAISSSVLTDTSGVDFDAEDVRDGDIVTIFDGVNFGDSFTITTHTTTTLTLSPAPQDDGGPNISYRVTQQNPGTVTISAIPGGILGSAPVIIDNNEVHIGNHTDTYVKVPVFNEDFVDITPLPAANDDKDLTDLSNIDIDLIQHTKISSAVGQVTFNLATLTTNINVFQFGVVVNDVVRISEPTAMAGDFVITAISNGPIFTLTLDGFSALSSSNEVVYEIISTNNGIAASQMPIIRVTRVDLMDSDSPPNPIAGVTVPLRDPVDARSTKFFSGGANPSIGIFRVYFLEPTTVQFDAGSPGNGLSPETLGTIFKVTSGGDTLYYRPDFDIEFDDVGDGVRKVRDSNDTAGSSFTSGTTGQFTSSVDFVDSSALFMTNGVVRGDMLTVFNGSTFVGNFYVTVTPVTETAITVSPSFTESVPFPLSATLTWNIAAGAQLTAQRISSQDMSNNREGSLFFVDVNVVSYDHNTTGDGPTDPPSSRTLPDDEEDSAFDIDEGQIAAVSGHVSYGYFFKQNTMPNSRRDESLAFSIRERLVMSFTDRFMPTSEEDPLDVDGKAFAFTTIGSSNNNTTGLESRNVRVNFENAPVIQQIQDFVDSGDGDVITQNMLIKHMIPSFVDLDITYNDGIAESSILPLLEELIDETDSDENLSASDIDVLIRRQGSATDMRMPLGLVAVVYKQDRTISVERSENALLVSRLSHFFPGNIVLERT